jgi:hypothetical protein
MNRSALNAAIQTLTRGPTRGVPGWSTGSAGHGETMSHLRPAGPPQPEAARVAPSRRLADCPDRSCAQVHPTTKVTPL